ncbi:MAG TPA: 4-alpha-glucanotransferase, partial [Mycobacteriales bacterium]|nr:4-alpha-glucanotransferase [Mycobacteriales bacterium]
PLYLRISALPEYERAAPELQQKVADLRPETDPNRIDRDVAWAAKRAALELLWPLHDPAALAVFREERGAGLAEFALFCALAERHGRQWQTWPEAVRSPQGTGVPAAAAELADEIAFWCWLQLQVERQLEYVAATGVLVIHDLAVGVDASGADAWALQDVLATGSTVGAPPDSFNQQGQDWGLPPWRPDRLRDCGFAPYREMVRACLRSAGGLRIDHVMGLFRLWWAPPGGTAADGTYLSYDADAMLAVLTIEASRVGALIVGEDLGTVSDTVRSELAATGILGSAVLWFEREEGGTGDFLPPQQWRELAMASVTTHDLPTAAGFLADEHVRVRAELDQLAVPVAQEYERVQAERDALLQMLTAAGLLAAHEGDAVLAMHGALVHSPCRLVVGAFGDAVGDLRQPNLPGTVDAYPNWRLPVADSSGRPLLLAELLAHPGVQRLSGVLSGCTLGSDTVPP